jgi:hypothetical protein
MGRTDEFDQLDARHTFSATHKGQCILLAQFVVSALGVCCCVLLLVCGFVDAALVSSLSSLAKLSHTT